MHDPQCVIGHRERPRPEGDHRVNELAVFFVVAGTVPREARGAQHDGKEPLQQSVGREPFEFAMARRLQAADDADGKILDEDFAAADSVNGVRSAVIGREPESAIGAARLSSDARCNTPRRFGIGRIETSGSVAMRGYSHLSDDEREQIGLLKVLGHSIGAIARAIRRPKSTISRELSRNRLPSGRYSPLHAAGAYQLRRRREALIEKDRALRSFVLDRLAEGWTPEQIAGWLKAGNERRLRAVGCETIYAFIYRAAQKAEQLWRYLTRRHKRRRPRRSRPSRDTIKDRVSIHERPENIDARTEAGHWEGDLIICKRTRPVLVLHERKSRVTLAARLVGKTAAETISVMLAVFARIEPALRKSITFDNDTAFAQHALLKTMCAMTTWFCDAYASWQKGGVENANGRLRRWLPRQIDIDKVSDEEIQDIILTANLTPRKCLGFKTPFQAILKELGKDVQIRFS